MSAQRKKEKSLITLKDEDLEQSVKAFADSIIENLREGYNNELEPFEVYAQKIRSHIHANVDQFRSRFSKGYRVLLEELNREAGGSSKNPQGENIIKP